MSRRWLLSLLCLSLLFLSLVQLTRAGGELRVNEALTKILLEKDPAEVLLAIENSSGKTSKFRVHLELLDTQDQITSQTTRVESIGTGSQTLSLSLPVSFSKLIDRERRHFLWYRLRYQLTEEGSPANATTEGIVSLSAITPDLFEVRVTTSQVVREGGRYHARVQAIHPITRRPAADVSVDAEIELHDDDNDKKVSLHASKITDVEGYALLDFALPPRFLNFPDGVQPEAGEINVIASKGAIVAEAKNDVQIDHLARILINTDKPLYQPGQVMHVRGLIFTPSKRAIANQNILIRISDPEELTLFRTVVRSSRFGVVNTDWPIPANTRLGGYRVWIGVDGEDQSRHLSYDVRISRYDLPNFTVSVDPDRKFYLPGQTAEVKVRADYLFGQPVTRGHVRVVRETEREWNYREQKWDITEGDKYEGETDAKGFFVARINLEGDHEDISDSNYQRFKDATYAAYFTDPTTNRTEQRRFDLRVTREAIHVYLRAGNYESRSNRSMPLKFYLHTFYADGSPASCQVSVNGRTSDSDLEDDVTDMRLATLRTNGYGLGKVSGVRVPRELENESEVDLKVSAVDSKGRSGSHKEDLSLDDEKAVLVETQKAIYRAGEPIVGLLSSSVPDQKVRVDLLREGSVIRSQRVQLNKGSGSVAFAYKSDFADKLTIAAYPDFPESEHSVGTHTILYPRDVDLKLNVRTSQASYRPGEDAQVNINVHGKEGSSVESALGVVVLDKAVEERFRTDQEFGGGSSSLNDSVQRFMGMDEEIAGVTLRDLQRLDMSKPISPDLDLVAEVLINRNRGYYPSFFGSDQYETAQANVFQPLIKEGLKRIKEALNARYVHTAQYPNSEPALRRFLLESNLDFNSFRDPWGTTYRTEFSVDKQADVVTFISAGADKRFETVDDFSAESLKWPYFRPVGEAIDRAVGRYHDRTGGFIRDLPTLREQLFRDSLDLSRMLDRWGEQYRFDFEVKESRYVINIRSGGPDKKFSTYPYYAADDFVIWTSSIDYFAESRARIEAALNQNLRTANKFPQSDQELREALGESRDFFESLRDPWGRRYYSTFRTQPFYGDRVRVVNQANLGEPAMQRTEITPVTRTIALMTLRSTGVDGQAGTADDFDVANLSGMISEQARGDSAPQPITSGVVVSRTRGVIYGVVTDPNGAVIPATTITIKQSFGTETYQTWTSEDGNYSVADLLPGLYEVRFEAQGFTLGVLTNVLVRASNLTEVNATLQPGSVQETVMVTSGAMSLVNATSSSLRTVHSMSMKVITKSGGSSQESTPRLREYFPETLLWQPSIETDKQGRAQINFKLADNITTWKLAVVGSTEDGRVGATETEIKSFQPFFVEHDPPRVLTEGDEISLPVVVRNYLARAQKVDLEIKPESWFALLGPARKQTSVVAGDATRETFDLRATASLKDGKQRITAIAGDANDAIEKPITVHPDGEELSVTAGDILGDSAAIELNIPETMIPNSKQAELKIYPNLMTHLIESVEGIMARPYGCGEQTISSTYPSLLLLRHRKKSGEDFPLRARAERYLNDGYSRLLNYRDESGGFTYWGNGNPDLALTAYALRFFTDAADVISVDKDVIDKAREWLVKQQRTDGGWSHEYGSGTTNANRSNLVLTAYMTRVLAKTEADPGGRESSASLKRALNYLSVQAAQIDEPYVLASYALAAIDVGDMARAKPVIEKLRGMGQAEGSTTYWSLETNTPFYGWGLTGRIETTAVVVQALTRYCDSQTVKCELLSSESPPVIKRALLFLLKQKDRYGVWYSTQATINVLDAMLALFATGATEETQSPAEILVNGNVVRTVEMPAGNRLLHPITLDISEFVHKGTNKIEIRRASGSSFASVQGIVNYYVPWSAVKVENHSSGLRLVAKFDKTEGKVNDRITCHVEAERVGFSGYGMMLAEIGLPPGAEVDRSSLEMAMKNSGWTFTQYDVLPDRVVVYLWPRAGGVKFDFQFRPRFGLNAKTAPSVIYDYYNPEARAVAAPLTFRVK
jgi:A-macroglobulin TED domain/Alpha-2-macroglobulin family/Carboxypeptidase regulatory-like domain/MG2 domain/A-macroglobulin receptor binding domain/Macroglobulin domain MG3/Alpha-2-macroglobulin bait region domain